MTLIRDPQFKKMGKHIAKRIRQLSCYEKYMLILKEIADKFELVSDVEDFDDCMCDLYDWGDTPLITTRGKMQKKICWIATNF